VEVKEQENIAASSLLPDRPSISGGLDLVTIP
jgi:hypothetical protein